MPEKKKKFPDRSQISIIRNNIYRKNKYMVSKDYLKYFFKRQLII